MQSDTQRHPYLDAFIASLVPRQVSTGHMKDPPAPHVLPLPPGSPEAERVRDLLLGADHDLRDDHAKAGAVNLALAEMRLRRLVAEKGMTPPREAATSNLRAAQEELAAGHTARALASLADAVRAVCNGR
jgi:hypothetical protein